MVSLHSPGVNGPAMRRPGPALMAWSHGADAAGPGCSICFVSTGWWQEAEGEEAYSAASSAHRYHQGVLEVHLPEQSRIMVNNSMKTLAVDDVHV